MTELWTREEIVRAAIIDGGEKITHYGSEFDGWHIAEVYVSSLHLGQTAAAAIAKSVKVNRAAALDGLL